MGLVQIYGNSFIYFSYFFPFVLFLFESYSDHFNAEVRKRTYNTLNYYLKLSDKMKSQCYVYKG